MSKLTFDQLRAGNVERIPLFKNRRGEVAHPMIDGSDWSLSDWMTAITGEVGEAASLVKQLRRGDIGIDEFYPKEGITMREALAKELADIACYLDIMAMQIGSDLGQAVTDKFNEVSERIGVDVKLGTDD